jgi:two-component system CheB/CheR fusion protein
MQRPFLGATDVVYRLLSTRKQGMIMAAPTYYVGIGASAGGLEAIEHFFQAMPRHTGMAFIVIQHLSPDYKSLMVELLSKKTSIPVCRAEDGMEVEADTIYLIPPKKNLTIFHGRLVLNEQETARGINLPIDIFLLSLAEDQGEKAIAVILSGTGSDGTRGVRAVKEHGGMVMVQDEASAKFDGMPKAAISTGVADFVLPPEAMAAQLLAFAKHEPLLVRDDSEQDSAESRGITKLFALVRNKTKVDFTYYKPGTVTRRIERRMMVTHASSLEEYIEYVQSYPAEIDALYKEFLIGVTSFFRDVEAFRYLAEECLPALFRNAGDREVRFWVAGCSSGEEAYSLAILAHEYMDATGDHKPVKIFATDLDQNAIQAAAAGVYPESIAADVNPTLLTKYFHKNGDSFQVARRIRELVVFSRHNLIADPPFTKIDLISCRNLLIYLQPKVQQKIFEYFNFSLNPDGILFLGSSESLGDASVYFQPVHHKFRIFRSVGKRSGPKAMSVTSVPSPTPGSLAFNPYVQRGSRAGFMDERVLERFLLGIEGDILPLSAIVTEDLQVMHIFGDASPVFRIPSGRLSMELSSLARKDMTILLTSLVQKAFRSGEEQETTVMMDEGEARQAMTIRVRLLPQRKGHPNLAAMMFLPAAQRPGSPTIVYDLSKESEERIRDLESELQLTRENLQATIEELQTSNEELQATNEELIASNEELQSTNEELQATNEELYTVNSEYQNKIYELVSLHHDIDNILNATGVGILLLDENKAIRRFSPPITRIFSVLEQDVGRPFSHIAHDLEDVDLPALVDAVMATQKTLEREVRAGNSGQVYHMQISPYSVGPSDFAGAVLSFWDITASVRLRQELSALERRLHKTVRLALLGFWVSRGTEGDQYWGEETFAVFGIAPKKTMDLPEIVALFDPEFQAHVRDAVLRVNREHVAVDTIARLRPDLGAKWIRILGRWEEGPDGGEVSGIYQDVTCLQDWKTI